MPLPRGQSDGWRISSWKYGSRRASGTRKRAMLGVESSFPTTSSSRSDDECWGRVAGYAGWMNRKQRRSFVHFDYFGREPPAGAHGAFGTESAARFPTRGRFAESPIASAGDATTNVAVASLTEFDAQSPSVVKGSHQSALPLPIRRDRRTDPRTADQAATRSAAFRAATFRGCEPRTQPRHEKLDWVQRAGAQLRWTGSWLTLFATPDPRAVFLR